METLTLKRVFRKDKETRYGIRKQVSIQAQEYGDEWLSSFKTKGTENWAEGMSVDVEITKKGDFINFVPIISGSASAPAKDLEARVSKLEAAVFSGTAKGVTKEDDGGFGDEGIDF